MPYNFYWLQYYSEACAPATKRVTMFNIFYTILVRTATVDRKKGRETLMLG